MAADTLWRESTSHCQASDWPSNRLATQHRRSTSASNATREVAAALAQTGLTELRLRTLRARSFIGRLHPERWPVERRLRTGYTSLSFLCACRCRRCRSAASGRAPHRQHRRRASASRLDPPIRTPQRWPRWQRSGAHRAGYHLPSDADRRLRQVAMRLECQPSRRRLTVAAVSYRRHLAASARWVAARPSRPGQLRSQETARQAVLAEPTLAPSR